MGKQWSDAHQAFIETDPPPVRETESAAYWRGARDQAHDFARRARERQDLQLEAEALEAMRSNERRRDTAAGGES